METFWIRKSGSPGYFGPLTIEQLRDRLARGIFETTHETRLAVPGATSEVLDNRGWQPAWRLLGLPEPAAEPQVHRRSKSGVAGLLRERRAASYYSTLRRLVKLFVIVALAALGVRALVGLYAAWQIGFLGFLVALGAVALEACAIVLGYHFVLMVIDVADCQLRAEDDRLAARG